MKYQKQISAVSETREGFGQPFTSPSGLTPWEALFWPWFTTVQKWLEWWERRRT